MPKNNVTKPRQSAEMPFNCYFTPKYLATATHDDTARLIVMMLIEHRAVGYEMPEQWIAFNDNTFCAYGLMREDKVYFYCRDERKEMRLTHNEQGEEIDAWLVDVDAMGFEPPIHMGHLYNKFNRFNLTE